MEAIHIAPQVLFTVSSFPVTNAMVTEGLVSLGLLGLAYGATRRLKDVPSGMQFWAEVLVETVYDFIQGLTKNDSHTRKMFPLVMTLFLLILFGNLFAYIPGLPAITYHDIPFFRVITTDYSFVLMLTLVSFLVAQTVLFATGGFGAFAGKFLNVSGPWAMKPINLFVGILELIGELAKIISLSFRLFGNMFAEEVLVMVISGFMPFLVPLPFSLLGLLATFIQPAVFGIFTSVNIASNISGEGNAHH